MAKLYDMNDYELAFTLNEWQGDAANSFESFSDTEKRYLNELRNEACRRFIEHYCGDDLDD